MKMKTFEFKEKGHRYTLGGKPMTGVTTVLQVLAKPALIGWAANMAVDFIIANQVLLPEEQSKEIVGTTKEWLELARTAHTRKKEEAGEAGTDTHAKIEEIIKSAIETRGGLIDNITTNNKQIQNFIDWAIQNKVKFLESEKQIYSESLFVAGTADFVCEIDGKKLIGDIKTSSGIYPEHFYQTAAYRLLLEEMGHKDFIGSVIVNIKKDGTFNADKDVAYRYDYQTDKDAFLAALTIYRANATFKNGKRN